MKPLHDRSVNESISPKYAATLWLLTFLFFLRVLGQVLVAFLDVSFLPPMEEWYSGLIPYPVLFALQCLILILQFKINADITLRDGFFAARRFRIGRFILWFSYIYFASMVLRYWITMALHPERRWFTGTIPIFFHFVLAGYLFALGHYHSKR